jgi:hypothetical protein
MTNREQAKAENRQLQVKKQIPPLRCGMTNREQATAENRQRQERATARAGVLWGKRGGGLRGCDRYRGSFDYAQDRLFALERRAQDDSKNRQPQVLRLRSGGQFSGWFGQRTGNGEMGRFLAALRMKTNRAGLQPLAAFSRLFMGLRPMLV